ELVATLPDAPPWRLARPARIVVGDDVDISDLVLRAGEQEIAASGRVGWASASDARLTLRQVRPDPICKLRGGVRCAGQLGGRLRVTGTGTAPRLDVTMSGAGLRVEDVEYGTLDATAQYADRRAAVGADLRHPQAGTVHVDGSVPVDLA